MPRPPIASIARALFRASLAYLAVTLLMDQERSGALLLALLVLLLSVQTTAEGVPERSQGAVAGAALLALLGVGVVTCVSLLLLWRAPFAVAFGWAMAAGIAAAVVTEWLVARRLRRG